MEDLAFTDKEGIYFAVDVKTHREGTQFNMPNLISVQRLSRFYESDLHVFALIMIKYAMDGTTVKVSDVMFSPIEFLDWDCLTVGAQEEGALSLQQYRTGDPATVLAGITQPVLLLWSGSRILPSTEPQRFIDFLKNADVEFHAIANAGHVLPIEGGEASAPVVRAFLDRLEAAGKEGVPPSIEPTEQVASP